MGYFSKNTSLQHPVIEAKMLDQDQQKNSSSRYIWAPSPWILQPTSLFQLPARMQGWFAHGFCLDTWFQNSLLDSESVFPRIKVLKAKSLEKAKACVTSWGSSTFTGTGRGALRFPSTWGPESFGTIEWNSTSTVSLFIMLWKLWRTIDKHCSKEDTWSSKWIVYVFKDKPQWFFIQRCKSRSWLERFCPSLPRLAKHLTVGCAAASWSCTLMDLVVCWIEIEQVSQP